MYVLISKTGIVLLKLLSRAPLTFLYLLSSVLAVLLYDVFRIRRGVTLTNLRNAFPDRDEREIRKIARLYYRHFSDLVCEAVKCLTISEAEIRRRCTLENPEELDRILGHGRSVIAILGHYGNWEWGALASALMTDLQVIGVYKPLRNPYFDDVFRTTRERFGVKMVPMNQVGRYYIRNRNEQFVNCLIADQAPRRAEVAHWMTFLEQDTAVHNGAEKLATAYDHPVMFVHMDKVGRGRYTIRIESVEEHPKEAPEQSITERHVRILEEQIRRRPELWLWSHRRWKRKRPAAPKSAQTTEQ